MSVQKLDDGTTIEDPLDYIAGLILNQLDSNDSSKKRYARLVLFDMLEHNERTICMSQITNRLKTLIIGGEIKDEQRPKEV